jgi:hypothetical protein
MAHRRMNGTARTPLSPRLMAAFKRLQADRTRLEKIPGHYPRSVRLGMDYAMRAGGLPETDEDADSFASMALVLGTLQQRDPRGDPPATCTAHEKADRAGAAYGQAFTVLGTIRDCTHELAGLGMAVSALPAATMRVLQQAARGERVAESELAEVLAAAQQLVDTLVMQVLRQS